MWGVRGRGRVWEWEWVVDVLVIRSSVLGVGTSLLSLSVGAFNHASW